MNLFVTVLLALKAVSVFVCDSSHAGVRQELKEEKKTYGKHMDCVTFGIFYGSIENVHFIVMYFDEYKINAF